MNLLGLSPLRAGYSGPPPQRVAAGCRYACMQRPTVTRASAADVVGAIVLLTIAALLVVVALIVAAG
jgi:hypothetical protein